jgi:hypothetical protein
MVAKFFLVIGTLLLTGCATVFGSYTETKDIYIDNSSVNNFVGNPCLLRLNDRCLEMKPYARNPNSPYKREK